MRLTFLPVLAMSVALGGCVSVLPQPKAPEALYRLQAAQDFSGLSQNIIVREPEAPRLLAGQGMVSEAVDGALRLIPGVEWAGSATRQMQLAMIDSFEVGGGGYAVLPELGVIAPFELASQLKVFNLQGETAVCEMSVSVVTTGNRQLLARTEIRARETALSNTARDRAQALRQAGSACAAQVATFVIDTIPDAD